MGVDLPLAADGEERRAAALAFDRASRLLPEAAAIEADLALRISFLDAWSAAEEASIRSRDLAAAEGWLAAAERRVEAGADPPFEAALVAAEAAAARLALADARERARLRGRSSRRGPRSAIGPARSSRRTPRLRSPAISTPTHRVAPRSRRPSTPGPSSGSP